MKIIAEYVWIDGTRPTARVRSKSKVLEGPIYHLADIPNWGFDGSSTQQATGDKSDCELAPVTFIKDPLRGGANVIVLCEVNYADGSPHASNTRARLRQVAEQYAEADAWFGIEQEYTFFDGIKPLGWPDNGFPAPQGGYYCGVGADETYGRPIVEEHLQACLEADLLISGINAEVMPAQWEFQIGPLGPLAISDQIWMARWLLYRIAEEHRVTVRLHPKPVKGDWNGAAAHTNFSTKEMRAAGGLQVIEAACQKLSERHPEHLSVYGVHNDQRLTGRHETCSINEFKYGNFDRGASIRIPMYSLKHGFGYLEDRRPAANADPYLVCYAMLETVCGSGFVPENASDE